MTDKEYRLDYLRKKAADRPAQARYLETLISHWEAGGTEDDEPDPTSKSVSWDAQIALSADVKNAFTPIPEGHVRSENHYGEYRDKADQASAKRQRTIARQEDSLESLMVIGSDESGNGHE